MDTKTLKISEFLFLLLAAVGVPAFATPPAAPATQSAWEKKINQLYPPLKKGEKPDWLTQPVAMEALDPETVLQPWTPVRADQNSVQVWNRQYDLGDGGLPRQITAADQALLVDPIRFEIQLEGQPAPIKLAAPKLVESHKGQVEYLSRTVAGSTSIQVKSIYEYDGFSRFDLTIDSPRELAVNRMELIVPLKSEHALHYNSLGIFHIGDTPQKHNSADILPSRQGEVYAEAFKSCFWVGDHHRGLCWFSESDQWVRPAKNKRVVRMVRQGDRTELRIVYIDGPARLPSRISLSFGLMATPVKPLPKGWRSWRFSTASPGGFPAASPPAVNQVIYWSSFRLIPFYPRPRDPAVFKQTITATHDAGAQRIYPYLAPTLMGTRAKAKSRKNGEFDFTSPEWAVFGSEWAAMPNYPESAAARLGYKKASLASSWADFSLWCVKQWIVKGGADGIYTDGAWGNAETSAEHGCGYIDAQGVRQPTYPIYATRNYYKRLAWLFQKYAHGQPAILAHTSSVIGLPVLSFADIVLDGEQFFYPIREWNRPEDPSYLAFAPLDAFQAELMTQQFGLVPVFLPAFRNDNAQNRFPGIIERAHPTREFLALTLMHDILVWPIWCNAKVVNSAYSALAQFDTGADDATFHPYWERINQSAVKGEGVKLSFYRRPNKILAIAVNTLDHPQPVEIDFAKLGLADGKIVNGENKEPLISRNEIIRLTIPARDFRLIEGISP
jgi:hypothetical protein